MNKRGLIAKFIGIFVVLLIGVSLIKPISEAVTTATANMTTGNVTNTGSIQTSVELIKLAPPVFGICIAIFGIWIVYNALKNAFGWGSGGMGDEDDSSEEPDDEDAKDYKDKRYSYTVKQDKPKVETAEFKSKLNDVPISADEIKEKEKKLVKSKYD